MEEVSAPEAAHWLVELNLAHQTRQYVTETLRDLEFPREVIDGVANWKVSKGKIYCPFLDSRGVDVKTFHTEAKAIKDAYGVLPRRAQGRSEQYAIFESDMQNDDFSVNLWIGTPALACWVGEIRSVEDDVPLVHWYKMAEDHKFYTRNKQGWESFYHGPGDDNRPLATFSGFEAGKIPTHAVETARREATDRSVET